MSLASSVEPRDDAEAPRRPKKLKRDHFTPINEHPAAASTNQILAYFTFAPLPSDAHLPSSTDSACSLSPVSISSLDGPCSSGHASGHSISPSPFYSPLATPPPLAPSKPLSPSATAAASDIDPAPSVARPFLGYVGPRSLFLENKEADRFVGENVSGWQGYRPHVLSVLSSKHTTAIKAATSVDSTSTTPTAATTAMQAFPLMTLPQDLIEYVCMFVPATDILRGLGGAAKCCRY